MLREQDAAAVADAYDLGDSPVLVGPIARGEVGQVWRISTSSGSWAVKEPFDRPSIAEATDDAIFQELVHKSGVRMPGVVKTRTGDVLADVGSATVRVYTWVELCERDARLDPETVGRIVANIHRVEYVGDNPVDPWYTDPVGADRWDDLASLVTDDVLPDTVVNDGHSQIFCPAHHAGHFFLIHRCRHARHRGAHDLIQSHVRMRKDQIAHR